jgi:hypothetical protein
MICIRIGLLMTTAALTLFVALGATAAAAQGSWLQLQPGREAFVDPKIRSVCDSSAALHRLLTGRKTANCAIRWGAGKATVLAWGKNSFGPDEKTYFTDVRIRGNDGKVGVVPIGELIPIVPSGTWIVLRRPCACAGTTASAPRARVVSQVDSRLVVQTRSGLRHAVSVYDVTNTSGRCIFSFVEPGGGPDFNCPR